MNIKLDDELIIVERLLDKWDNTQFSFGYLVSLGNKKQLENALFWAGIANDKASSKFVHTYKNGNFKLSLYNAPKDGSPWNCLITCPDNKKYLFAINDKYLLNLVKNTSFVNGSCESSVWLGRKNGIVCALTEEMSEFKKYKVDNIVTCRPNLTTYKEGQVVRTKSDDYIYLGEIYKHFDIYKNLITDEQARHDSYLNNIKNNYPKVFMVIYKNTLEKKHAYYRIYQACKKSMEICIKREQILNTKKRGLPINEFYNVKNLKVSCCDFEYDPTSSVTFKAYPPYVEAHKHFGFIEEHDKIAASCPPELYFGNLVQRCFTKEKEVDLSDIIEAFEKAGGKVVYDEYVPEEHKCCFELEQIL